MNYIWWYENNNILRLMGKNFEILELQERIIGKFLSILGSSLSVTDFSY